MSLQLFNNNLNSLSIFGVISDSQEKAIRQAFKKDIQHAIEYIKKHSIGDYLIEVKTLNNDIAYIASSGFSGAYLVHKNDSYFYCKNLSDVSKLIPYSHFDDKWIASIIGLLQEGLVMPNKDIYKIDALDVLYITNGHLNSFNIMASVYDSSERESSSQGIFPLLVQSIEEHANYGDITVMLSGGVDSTLISLAVEECGYKARFVNTLRSASLDNNPLKAQEVARQFNWALETINDDSFFQKESQDFFFKQMSQNLINPMNPHWDVDSVNGVILSGQNADSIIGLDINKAGYFNVFLKQPKLYSKLMARQVIGLDYPRFQKLYNKALGIVLKEHGNNMGDTYLALKSNKFKLDNDILKDYDYLQALTTRSGSLYSDRAKIEMASHYFYRTYALRLLSSQLNQYGSKTMLPFQSSPYLYFYANQTRKLKELLNPKWREASEISKRLGSDYYSFVSKLDSINPNQNYALKVFSLKHQLEELEHEGFLTNLVHKFDIKNDRVIRYLRDRLLDIQNKNKSHSLNKDDLTFSYKLLNLYLLK